MLSGRPGRASPGRLVLGFDQDVAAGALQLGEVDLGNTRAYITSGVLHPAPTVQVAMAAPTSFGSLLRLGIICLGPLAAQREGADAVIAEAQAVADGAVRTLGGAHVVLAASCDEGLFRSHAYLTLRLWLAA